jgi:uncharacterized protein YkwD
MKTLFCIIFLFTAFFLAAQKIDSLNTAKNCLYMTADEREMIYEINRVRSNPSSYLQYLTPLLVKEKQSLKNFGKGTKNYSLTFSTSTVNGKETSTVDTTWHYTTEEEVKALATLINDLKKLKPLSVLQPDTGIYKAARKHAMDNQTHDWSLRHTGSDGSSPWDRIVLFSPSMYWGNENIAGRYGYASPIPRDYVLQLLIDSGIPGYGHRYNLLDPSWTHVACTTEDNKGYHWWIQNFAQKKKAN